MEHTHLLYALAPLYSEPDLQPPLIYKDFLSLFPVFLEPGAEAKIKEMNVEELSMIGPDVDLATVDAINKKRLLAFVNHFVISTTMFLNKLSKSCEHGLMSLENKIQKLESSIVILESKLNSVPGLEDNNVEAPAPIVETLLPKVESNEEKIEENINENDFHTEKKEEDVKQEKEQTLDPALLKYVKMLQFGVPLPAVKLKMEQENVDPSLHQLVFNYNK